MLKRLIRHPFYEKAMTYIAVVYVFLIVLELMDASIANSSGYRVLDWLLWFIFVCDYFAQLYYADNILEYV